LPSSFRFGSIFARAPVVLSRDRSLCTIGTGHFDRVLTRQHAKAFDVLDLILAEEEFDTFDDAIRDIARALDDAREVDAKIIVADAPLFRRDLHGMINLGVLKQRLGRNAAPIQANAA
jgi:hypothetical protein